MKLVKSFSRIKFADVCGGKVSIVPNIWTTDGESTLSALVCASS